METYKLSTWFREYGWRHLVGLTFVVFSMYPILYVLSNSLLIFRIWKTLSSFQVVLL